MVVTSPVASAIFRIVELFTSATYANVPSDQTPCGRWKRASAPRPSREPSPPSAPTKCSTIACCAANRENGAAAKYEKMRNEDNGRIKKQLLDTISRLEHTRE